MCKFQMAEKEYGNIWESEKEKPLFSIILYPSSVSPMNTLISMVISGHLRFSKHYLSNIKIKWPNDIYVNGGKLQVF